MGEIAEDMLNGTVCQLCGMYFQGENPNELHSHGYPVVCRECWKNLSKRERREHQQADRPTL